jgi:hypothetical protein
MQSVQGWQVWQKKSSISSTINQVRKWICMYSFFFHDQDGIDNIGDMSRKVRVLFKSRKVYLSLNYCGMIAL